MRTLRRFLLALFYLITLGFGKPLSAIAETLTLQLPTSRASHTFWLFELDDDASEPSSWEIFENFPSLGIPSGPYWTRYISGLQPIGGTVDPSGNVIPQFLQGFIDRTPGTSTFFVFDVTTSEAVHAGSTDLVNAAWVDLFATDPPIVWSLPTSKKGSQFLLNATGTNPDTQVAWSGWWQVSTKPPASWLGADGTVYEYGFMEAWAYVPRGMQTAQIYDLSTYEYTSALAPDLTGEGVTWTGTTSGFWPTVSVFVATGPYGESFGLFSPDGAAQTVSAVTWSSDLNCYGCNVTVGYGKSFWLQRLADLETSPTCVVNWGSTVTDFDLTSYFGSGPNQQWQTLYFRASPSRNPFGMSVRRTKGGDYSINWGSPTGTYVSNPPGNQTVWVEWYEGSVDVDVNGGWTVMEGGTDLGQGPDFIDWPVFEQNSGYILLPRSWLGTSFWVYQSGNPVPYVEASGNISLTDAFTGANYLVNLDIYQVPLPWEPYTDINVVDYATNQISPNFPYGAGTATLSNWHPRKDLQLKMSVTRWNHNLQVRCANGEIYPITKNRVQGDWSFDPVTGQSWFVNYGYFDATSQRLAEVPWHLYDATTSEYLTADSGGNGTSFINATDNTDTDGDGLEDWYEHMIGTDPNDVDTDNDGVNDGQEVANGTNPRAGSAASDPNATLKVFTPLE